MYTVITMFELLTTIVYVGYLFKVLGDMGRGDHLSFTGMVSLMLVGGFLMFLGFLLIIPPDTLLYIGSLLNQ